MGLRILELDPGDRHHMARTPLDAAVASNNVTSAVIDWPAPVDHRTCSA
jgi:hypothetical protein